MLNHTKKTQQKGFVGWLIKKKIAKDEKPANAILIVVLIITIVAIYFTWFGGNHISKEDRGHHHNNSLESNHVN